MREIPDTLLDLPDTFGEIQDIHENTGHFAKLRPFPLPMLNIKLQQPAPQIPPSIPPRYHVD